MTLSPGTFRMAKPQRHRNGIYYMRLWVPEDVFDAVGKREVTKSLRTRDLVEAWRRYNKEKAVIEAAWDALRAAEALVAPPTDTSSPTSEAARRQLSQKEAEALAGEFYRATIKEHGDNPGRPERWIAALRDVQHAIPREDRTVRIVSFRDSHFHIAGAHPAMERYGSEVDAFLRSRGDLLDGPSVLLLCSRVAFAKRDAYEHLLRNAKGDFAADPKAGRFPAAWMPNGAPVVDAAVAVLEEPNVGGDAGREEVRLDDLLEKWHSTPGYAARTLKSWAGKLRMLMSFAGKTDVAALTRNDVERWRDDRIAKGTDPGTVSAGDLAGVRGVLGWASQHSAFPSINANVALGVKQRVSKIKTKLREKGFTFKEANKILAATLVPLGDQFTEAGAGARRWVPWLCAYSGARIGEIAQMHSKRITLEEVPDGRKYWCMLITPEDGTVKDGEARTIPLHSHILEQGFIEYVRRRQKARKPLFFEPELGDGGSRQAERVGQRLGEWVKVDLRIVGVQPNHGWRHRFETMGRALDLRPDLVNHITGHVGVDVAARYGDYLIDALSTQIEKLPPYVVKGLVISKGAE